MGLLDRFLRGGEHRLRGSLTLLPDGKIVLGLPGDWTPQQVERIKVALDEWLRDETQMLILPFSLEFIDRRTKR